MSATSGFFKKILSSIQRPRDTDSAPPSLGTTRHDGDYSVAKAGPFGLLPPEMIHRIVTSLPPSSAASLALASHSILRILGTQYFTCLGPDMLVAGARGPATVEDRAIFLTGLVRDLPVGSGFYCYHCHKIHFLPLKKIKKRRFKCMETRTPNHVRIFDRLEESLCPRKKSSYNWNAYSNVHIGAVYHHGFFFEHVQMAMQLHRGDLPHLLKGYLAHLSLTKRQVLRMCVFEDYKGFHFFEPRIVDGQMIVRAQSWIVIPSNERVNVHKQFLLPKYFYNTTPCAHFDIRFTKDNRLTQFLRCRLTHVRYQTPSPCVDCVGNLRCPMCPTEVQVDIKTFWDNESKTSGSIMLVVTRWQLVGDGASPHKEHWANRLSTRCNPWNWHEGGPLSDIKNAFENQPGTKFDLILDAREAWNLVKRDL